MTMTYKCYEKYNMHITFIWEIHWLREEYHACIVDGESVMGRFYVEADSISSGTVLIVLTLATLNLWLSSEIGTCSELDQ